jgi:chlorite dismutase
VSAVQPPRLFTFAGGDSGAWRIVRSTAVAGEPLPEASRLAIIPGDADPGATKWRLRGITSNERYVTRAEKGELVAKQEGLGRPASTCAALIPIRKTPAWWALPQDERRRIFEESSRHVRIGLEYLPAVARRLHHCRDLGEGEPFDFITWFEYAPADASAFDALVAELRASEEWRWIEREIDIRVARAAP